MHSDGRLTEFLKWMSTNVPGVYLLGSLNRHITVYSQQCRAINLIHTLIHTGGLDGKSVAVVGAGFAGLTAACALAQRGWSVRVHERADRLRTTGAGIYIYENGLRVLEAVGAYDLAVAGAPMAHTPSRARRSSAASSIAANYRTGERKEEVIFRDKRA